MTNQEPDKEQINLAVLAAEYSDEDKARGLLESLRWPCPQLNKGTLLSSKIVPTVTVN